MFVSCHASLHAGHAVQLYQTKTSPCCQMLCSSRVKTQCPMHIGASCCLPVMESFTHVNLVMICRGAGLPGTALQRSRRAGSSPSLHPQPTPPPPAAVQSRGIRPPPLKALRSPRHPVMQPSRDAHDAHLRYTPYLFWVVVLAIDPSFAVTGTKLKIVQVQIALHLLQCIA